MADLSFTVKGYIEVWLGTVKVSQHSSEREAIASAQRHANAAKKDGTYTLKYPSVEMRVIGVRASITDTTKPTAPVLQSVVGVNEDTVRLTWTASVDLESGVNGYQAFRDGVPVPGTTQSTTLDVSGQPYANATWTVVGTDNAGNSSDPSNSVVGKPLDQTGPTAPVIAVSNLSYNSQSIALTTLPTDARSGIATGTLERKPSSGSTWSTIGPGLSTSNFPYPSTGLNGSTSYDYRLTWYDNDGNSVTSTVVTLQTPAAPQVGDLVHGQITSLSGSGWGSKPQAAPLVWDNCMHGQAPGARWSYVAPNTSGAASNMDYRAPGTGLVPAFSLPHSKTTKTLCGMYQYINPNGSSTGGGEVGMTKGIPFVEGQLVYISYLFRNSPGFYYSQTDENYKLFHWDSAADFFGASTDGYLEYKGLLSSTSTPYIKYNGGGGLQQPDATGISSGSFYTNPPGSPGSSWVRHEMLWALSRTTAGFGYVIINNATTTLGPNRPTSGTIRLPGITPSKLAFWHHGTNAPPTGATAYAQIGSYARSQVGDTQSWRAFCDGYVDTSLARVVVTDNANYDSATKIIVQPCVSWTPTDISFNFWQADLVLGSTGHIFVYDAANNRQYFGARPIS